MAFFNVLKRKKVPLPEKGTAKPTPATRALGKVTETKREKEKSEKREKKAIEEIYGVTPVRINVITIPAKKVFVRNRVGMKASGKKAVVYLKKGDKIEFV